MGWLQFNICSGYCYGEAVLEQEWRHLVHWRTIVSTVHELDDKALSLQ